MKRRIAKFNSCNFVAFVLHMKGYALATKFQAMRYNHRHENQLPFLKRFYGNTYLDYENLDLTSQEPYFLVSKHIFFIFLYCLNKK